MVSVSSDLDLDELRGVVERLRVEGVDVTVDAADFGLAVSPGADRQDIEYWRLPTRQRWVNRVLAALDDASATRPPH